MRVGHLQPTRPEWFDRNPLPICATMAATIAGADGGTVRSTYTVPTGRKSYLDLSQMSAYRTADGTPNNQIVFGLQLSDGITFIYAQIIKSSVSNYGPVGDQWLGQGGIFVAGNLIRYVTSCTFPDGTVTLDGGFKVTEFDA